MSMPFNKSAPHILHTQTGKVPVLDQNGLLYDGITELELTSPTDAYAKVEGMPFSKVTSETEKLQDALATIRASGAVDPDSMAKFEGMLISITKKTETGTATATKVVTPKA